MKFTLEIELGNEAMQTGDDVALALRRLSVKLVDARIDVGADRGTIRDANGNAVGKWAVSQ